MRRPETPSFAEPWQAQAFALAVALNEAGVFTWSEWTEALSVQLNGPDAAEDGSDYYHHWLATLEAVLAAKGATDTAVVDQVADAWQRAAAATPHGEPIVLENASR